MLCTKKEGEDEEGANHAALPVDGEEGGVALELDRPVPEVVPADLKSARSREVTFDHTPPTLHHIMLDLRPRTDVKVSSYSSLVFCGLRYSSRA